MQVYLDNAATTALDPAVLDAMLPYLTTHYGNPSSLHEYGRIAKVAVEKARKTVAHLLGVSPVEIFFTSGGTEGNHLALLGAIEKMGIRHVITSPIEHACVLEPLQRWVKQDKIQAHYVPLDPSGRIDYAGLETLLDSYQPALVSLMHANNEIGNLNDIVAIGTRCRRYNALFHTDAVQTVGHYPLKLADLPVDMLVGSAHKFHGPKGVGMVYIRREVGIEAQLVGGGQERWMRAGTENVPGIVGLAVALSIAEQGMEKTRSLIESLKAYMIAQLRAELPSVCFYGTSESLLESLYTVLMVNFPLLNDPAMTLFDLDIRKIAVSGGSACASGSQKISSVITTLYPNQTGVALRFSFSKYNTLPEIDYVVNQLVDLHRVGGL